MINGRLGSLAKIFSLAPSERKTLAFSFVAGQVKRFLDSRGLAL